jgi:hypothetical protein
MLFLTANISLAQVVLYPGDNIQSIVAANGTNTTFLLTTGIYHNQQITPKNGDTFIGEVGAIMSGSFTLSTWTGIGPWVNPSGFTTPGQQNGSCDAGHPMCGYPEDLFYDDTIQLRVAVGQVTVGCGCWSLDYSTGHVTVGNNPSRHTVEMSVTRSAFAGSATNVTVSGIVVEKYANPAQTGAIGDQSGTNWIVTENEVRYNHGAGIHLNSGSVAAENFAHHNGQIGIGAGGATNVLVLRNEISWNNQAGFNRWWDCGGVKVASVNHYTAIANRVHDNLCTAMWDDIDSSDVTYEDNLIWNNESPGILHEISVDALITSNTLCNNAGLAFPGESPPFGGQPHSAEIVIAGSSNTTVINNRIIQTKPDVNDDGVFIFQQDRGSGPAGTCTVAQGYPANNYRCTQNNIVSYNDVTFIGPNASGMVIWADYKQPQQLMQNNVFDHNSYHMMNVSAGHFWYAVNWPTAISFAQWQAHGQDVNATADTIIASCPSTATSGGSVSGGATVRRGTAFE